jgi:hypothetical protein
MVQTLTIEVPDTFAHAWQNLPPAGRNTLEQFARFLNAQEAEATFHSVDEEDEQAWDALFEDEQKVATFAHWADATLARSRPQPLDPARL